MTHEEEETHAAGKLATSQSSKSVSAAKGWNKGAVKKSKTVQDADKLENSRTNGTTPKIGAEKDEPKNELAGARDGLGKKKRKRRRKKKILTGAELIQHALRGLNTTMNDMPDMEPPKAKEQEVNPILAAALGGLKGIPNRPLYEGDFEEFEEQEYVPPAVNEMLIDAKKLLRNNMNSEHLFSAIKGRKKSEETSKKDKNHTHNADLEDAKQQLKSAKVKREEKPPKPKLVYEDTKHLTKEERLARLKAEFNRVKVDNELEPGPRVYY